MAITTKIFHGETVDGEAWLLEDSASLGETAVFAGPEGMPKCSRQSIKTGAKIVKVPMATPGLWLVPVTKGDLIMTKAGKDAPACLWYVAGTRVRGDDAVVCAGRLAYIDRSVVVLDTPQTRRICNEHGWVTADGELSNALKRMLDALISKIEIRHAGMDTDVYTAYVRPGTQKKSNKF